MRGPALNFTADTTLERHDHDAVVPAGWQQKAAPIRAEHEAAEGAALTALDHAIEAGRLLAKARADIGHGRFQTFVTQACGLAPRTARLYLHLHRHRDELPKRQRDAALSIRAADKLLRAARPEPEVEPGPERPPDFFRDLHIHVGEHPTGWTAFVWPHPSGSDWVHVGWFEPADTAGTTVCNGMETGIGRAWFQWPFRYAGAPDLTDPAWQWQVKPMAPSHPWRVARFNMLLWGSHAEWIAATNRYWEGGRA